MSPAARLAVISAALFATVGLLTRTAKAAVDPTAPIPAGATIDPQVALAMVIALNETEFAGWFDPADVMGVMEIESHFQIRAVSSVGALGLMQLMLPAARDRGYAGDAEGLFDPETNIRFGMRHLKWTWDYLESHGRADRTTWIGAYNAGVGNALKGYTPLGYVNRFVVAQRKWANVINA